MHISLQHGVEHVEKPHIETISPKFAVTPEAVTPRTVVVNPSIEVNAPHLGHQSVTFHPDVNIHDVISPIPEAPH